MALPAAMILSGVPQDQFTGDLQTVFNQGTVLLKTPETSPRTSPRSTSPSAESGISSLSTDTERSLDYYLDVIDKLEQKFLTLYQDPKDESSLETIMYQNRNLLDLGSNLTPDWGYRPAVLRRGVSQFFENRSQLSRLDGAELPPHKIVNCQSKGCGFQHPVYL